MRKLIAVAKKELNIMFNSPMPYIGLGVFALVLGLLFNIFVGRYVEFQSQQMMFGGGGAGLNIHILLEGTFQNVHFLLVLLIPFLTMRLVAEEKAQGTTDLLFSVPLHVSQILVGKLLAVMVVVMAFVAYTLFVPIFCLIFNKPDLYVVLYSYVGFFWIALAYVSVGIFCSTLTKNQVLAGVVSVVLCLTIFLFGILTKGMTHMVGDVLNYVSVTTHVDNFFKGVFSLKDVMYFVTFAFFWMFLSYQVLDSQSWR